MEQIRRCEWAGPDQIYIDYHDNEWGQPLHDDNKLFEYLYIVPDKINTYKKRLDAKSSTQKE